MFWDLQSVELLVSVADKVPYLAKAAGYNRSTVTDDGALPHELQHALDAAA